MKKRILFLLLIMTLSVSLLCSCFVPGSTGGEEGEGSGVNKDPEGNGEGNGEELPDGGIYNASSELYLIREASLDEDLFLRVMDGINGQREDIVKLAAVDSEPHAHEIVIGKTERAVSKEAIRLLGRLGKNKDSDVGILIYSDGSSVAIVFDDDADGITAKIAIDYFMENYLGESLTLPKGTAYSTTFDLVEGYGAKVDAEYEDAMWALMEQTVGEHGKSLSNAMKQLYSIYSSDMIIWLADLYEPSVCVCNALYGKDECEGSRYCGGSGFYYSNSARDTAGFLPDVETTYQALGLLNSTGVTRVSGGWKNMLDGEILEGIGYFVRSLQVEDGNFVHPQWAHLELGISRKSRDLKWATEILEMLDLRPYYTTPTGIPGIGAPKLSSAPTKPLGGNAVSAVSSVILTATHLPELESDVTFKNYLEGLNIKYNSYSGGNQIASLLGQITARDRELKKEGKNYQLIDILIDFLDENRNTENGTWDHTPKTDPKYSVYEGVNGLMKISAAYNTAGKVIPYAREASLTAIAAVTCDEKVGEVVDVYNPWHALTVIFGNLTSYGGAEGEALVNEMRQAMYADSGALLGATREKAQLFAKDGGSFSYNKDYSAANSQGCPAAVLYSKEGDVNGTVLGSSGLLDYLYNALGLKSCKVPLFGETERILFMEEIRSLDPGRKPPEDLSYSVEDFEEDVVGEEPIGQDISYKQITNGASIKVVERDDGEGKALRIDSNYYVNNSDSVTVDCRSNASLAKCFVFEGDFCVLSTNRYYSVQVKMGAAYMFALKWENEKITLWECSSSSNSKSVNTKFDPEIELGDWFRVRVEYYRGDEDTVRIKFFFDNLEDNEGEKLLAVTDNYYDEKGYKLNGKGTPASTYDNTLIYVLSDATVSMMIDNVASYKTNEEYTPVIDPENQPSFNVDAPDKDELKYGYKDGAVPTDFKVEGSAFVEEIDQVSYLKMGGTAETRVTIPLNLRTKKANTAVFDSTVYLPDAQTGAAVMTIVGSENTGNVFGFTLVCEGDGVEKYLSIYEYNGSRGAKIPGARIPIGEKAKLRIEYYNDEDNALIYVNGEFVGASSAVFTGAATRTATRLTLVVPGGESILIDDTVAERAYLDYSAATKPVRDAVTNDFEDGLGEWITSAGASVVPFGGSNAVRLGNGASIEVEAVKRSNLSSLLILEMNMTVKSVGSNGEIYKVILNDGEGRAVQSLSISAVDSKTVGIYEILQSSNLAKSPLLTFGVDETVKLKIEYFGEKKTTLIYKNDVLVAKTNILSNLETYRNAVDSVAIVSVGAGAVAFIDDLGCQTVYENYVEKDTTPEENPEKDKIDFESSSTGSLPGHLISTLNSDKADLRIEEMENTVSGETTKVAVFVTGEENNDSLGIMATEDLSGYSSIVFEADFKIQTWATGSIYQLFFSRAGNDPKNLAYAIFIDRASNGALSILDYSQSSKATSKSNVLASGIDGKVWNRLRVEYYKGDHETVRMKIFLNGDLVFVSDNYYGYSPLTPDTHPAPVTDIRRVYFYSFLATSGEMYVDNMSLYGTDEVCTDSVSQ